MPEITESTPREDYTIAGEIFAVFQPYAEGHVLSSGEASALNQVFAENIRNNFASKVKEAKEAGSFDHQVFQGNLDDYMSEYEFGVRRGGGGGRTGDPVQAEAMIIAREKVRTALVKKGHKLAEVPASEITRLAKDVLARADATAEAIYTAAKARVAAQQDVADVEIGEVNSAPEGEEASAKGKKKAAAEG